MRLAASALAQVLADLGRLGLEPPGFLQIRNRLVEPILLGEHDSQMMAQIRMIWQQPDGLLEKPDRFAPFSQCLASSAQQVQHFRVRSIGRQRLAIQRFRVAQLACLMKCLGLAQHLP